jgi:serine/threonine protein kinase
MPLTVLRYALYHSLRAMHRRGVAHCDFEPRNIVCDPDGRVTIIDLDCAQAHQCENFAMCGELKTAAEQLRIPTRFAVAFEVLLSVDDDVILPTCLQHGIPRR